MYVGADAVRKHFEAGRIPLVFKFDLEFAHPEFEKLLLAHQVVPLPNPPNYPQFNGKTERQNGELQGWLKSFGPDQAWTTEELQMEIQFCFTELEEVTERAMFGGASRREAYNRMERAKVDREAFLRDATEFRRQLLMRPNNRLSPMQAWRVAAKETLKKYGLVRYSRPSEVSRSNEVRLRPPGLDDPDCGKRKEAQPCDLRGSGSGEKEKPGEGHRSGSEGR